MHFQNDDVQDFDTRWDQGSISSKLKPTEVVLEGLYKSKLQDSARLHIVLAMCEEQENIRNNEPPVARKCW